MERRKFLGSAGLAGILATGMAPAVQAGQAIRWRLASSFPRSLDIAFGGAELFATKVREMSEGKFDISVYPADELMPAAGVLDGVQRGSVECAHALPYAYYGKDEAFALDGAIPFGLDSRQLTTWMQQGGGLVLLREFYKDFNVVNFPLGNTGAQMGGWFRKPVKSPADLKNLRIRTDGLAARVWERLGSLPRSLASGDIAKSFAINTLDAAEWFSPYDDLKLGLHRNARHYAYPSWWEGNTQLSLYVNHRAYESLATESRAILGAAATATHLEIQAQYDAKNPPALRELLAMGAQLMPFPKTVLDAAYKATTDLYAEIAGRNPHWKAIYGSYSRFLQDQVWGAQYFAQPLDDYLRQKMAKKEVPKKSAPAKRR